MTLNEKQQSLLGFEEYGFHYPYPDTLQLKNNVVIRENDARAAANARSIAEAEAASIEDDRQAQIKYDRDSSTGPMVTPKSNTLRGYKWMLRKDYGTNNVEFNPPLFAIFDGVIKNKAGADELGTSRSAAFNESHPHYQDFAPMRRNMAILRNYLLARMEEDGGVIYLNEEKTLYKLDDKHIKMMNEMAGHIGDAISSNTGGEPWFITRWARTVGHLVRNEDLSTPYTNAFMEAANIPDKGALVMYKYLEGMQKAHKDWPLLPRDQTPFSDENMRLYSRSSQMTGVIDAYDRGVMSELRAPENLKEPERAMSIHYAEEILKGLRNMMSNPEAQERASMFTDEDHDKSRKLLQVAMGFRDSLAEIKGAEDELNDGRSELQHNKILARSFEALEKLGYRMKIEGHKMLVEEYEMSSARSMEKSIEDTPSHYKTSESTESLMGQVESGLKEAARIQAQARLASKIIERQNRRAQKMAQASRISNVALQNMKMASTGTFSKADMRGVSISKVARKAQEAQDKAYADAIKEKADAPLLNDRGR